MIRVVGAARVCTSVRPAVKDRAGPASPYQHVVDLVPSMPVVVEPRFEVSSPVLNTSAAHYESVSRGKFHQSVTVGAAVTERKTAKDVTRGFVGRTGAGIPVACNYQDVSRLTPDYRCKRVPYPLVGLMASRV